MTEAMRRGEMEEANFINLNNEIIEAQEKETDLNSIDMGRKLEIETDWDKYIVEKREDGFYLTDDAGRYPEPVRVDLGSINPDSNPQEIKPNILRIDWMLDFSIKGKDVDYGQIKSVKFVN